jgi:very-short-patch-repair endonuclease
VIEIDGKIHDYNKRNDNQRDKIINLLGIYVLRIRNEDIENSITKVTADIQKIIMELETKLTHPKSLF